MICFACGTEFHLLVAFVLSTTIYKKERKLLFIIKDSRLIKYIEGSITCKIWEDIVVIDPAVSQETIDDQFRQRLPFIGTLHFFSTGFLPYNRLFVACQKEKINIILTDEGIGSYMPIMRFKSKDQNKLITSGIDLTKVNELWLFNPLLFSEKNLIPIKQISLEEFYSECYKNHDLVIAFKDLFGLRKDISFNYDFIYFRQYLSLIGNISKDADAFVDKIVCNLFRKYNLYVKDHPAYKDNPYIKIDNQSLALDIPWEVLLVLKRIDENAPIQMPQIYLSATSSAMFSTNSFGHSGDFIFINKILEQYTDYKDDSINDLINKSRQVFPKSHFYEPVNLTEFYNNVSEILLRKGYSPLDQTLEELREEENSWLRTQYIKYWQGMKEDNNSSLLIQTMKDQLDEYEGEILTYALSKSWKITRPFRKLSQKIRRNI